MEGSYITKYKTQSHWRSCRSITELLEKKYPGFSPVFQDDDKVEELKIKHLAIIDHRWLSESFLIQLKKLKEVQIDWYVFGDFTLKIALFKKHIDVLQQHNLTIFVASEAQKNLVTSIFPEVREKLKVKSYPLDEQRFRFSEEGRQKWRNTLNLKTGEKLVGYVGRISPQKGIIQLLQAFIQNQDALNAKLVLVGPIDSHPFWQYSEEIDSSFIPTFKKLLFLGDSKVEWIPWIDSSELPGLYSALDLFVSPSYFHDEDFGLTASEARACGARCLLTDWGGYQRYRGEPDVRLIGLEESNSGFKVHVPSLTKGLMEFVNAPISHPRPSALSSEEISEILNKDKFLEKNGKFNSELYLKLYLNYV